MDKADVGIMSNKYDIIMSEIDKVKRKTSISMQTVQQNEFADIFPALKDYQLDHTEHNLKKLCLEIREFCQSIYVTTRNDNEREIYLDMVKKLL